MSDRTPEQDFTDWFTSQASASTLGANRAPAPPVTGQHVPAPHSAPPTDPAEAFADYFRAVLGITQPDPTNGSETP